MVRFVRECEYNGRGKVTYSNLEADFLIQNLTNRRLNPSQLILHSNPRSRWQMNIHYKIIRKALVSIVIHDKTMKVNFRDETTSYVARPRRDVFVGIGFVNLSPGVSLLLATLNRHDVRAPSVRNRTVARPSPIPPVRPPLSPNVDEWPFVTAMRRRYSSRLSLTTPSLPPSSCAAVGESTSAGRHVVSKPWVFFFFVGFAHCTAIRLQAPSIIHNDSSYRCQDHIFFSTEA